MLRRFSKMFSQQTSNVVYEVNPSSLFLSSKKQLFLRRISP